MCGDVGYKFIGVCVMAIVEWQLNLLLLHLLLFQALCLHVLCIMYVILVHICGH